MDGIINFVVRSVSDGLAENSSHLLKSYSSRRVDGGSRPRRSMLSLYMVLNNSEGKCTNVDWEIFTSSNI